ncbi:MAG: protein kinase domain-containing protein [Actinoallomurus sp.]
MPFGEGSVLGRRYRLLSQVGRGGMGRVWHAHDDLLHRDVAVKEVIFPPGLTASDREVLYERTLREARSAARLSHPGIVTVHDVVEDDDRPWIVMEYVRARSLQQVLDADGRLPVTRVADIGVQMLAALRRAHASGVLHRDVKPANVLLDTRAHGIDRVVITDFGIARIEGDATLTQTGLVLGSPAYIAPERARGEPASPASDLWALGATLYAASEGRSPHDRVEAMAALTAVLHEEPDPPVHAGPLAPVLMGLLVKDPTQRMTAEQAATDLERATRDEAPSVASLPSGTAETWHGAPGPGSWTQAYGGSGGLPAEPDATIREPSGPVPGHGGAGTGPGMTPGLVPGMGPGTGSGMGPSTGSGIGPGTGSGMGPGTAAQPVRRRSMIVLIVVLAVLLVAGLATVFALSRYHAHNSPDPTPPPQPRPTPTVSASPSPSATPRPTTPPGYHRAAGPDGSKIAVPAGWTRQVIGPHSVRWTQTATGAHIQVDAIPWGMTDPVAHWRQFEREVVAKNTLPGFHATRLSQEFQARGWPASDLEYTWSTRDHGTLRAVDRGFTAGGRQYAILVAAPSGRWSNYSGTMDSIFNSFQPG